MKPHKSPNPESRWARLIKAWVRISKRQQEQPRADVRAFRDFACKVHSLAVKVNLHEGERPSTPDSMSYQLRIMNS